MENAVLRIIVVPTVSWRIGATTKKYVMLLILKPTLRPNHLFIYTSWIKIRYLTNWKVTSIANSKICQVIRLLSTNSIQLNDLEII